MKTITAIDVGTNTIKGIVAKQDKGGAIEILAIGKEPSLGVRNGETIKPSETAKAILSLKEKLAGQSQVKIKSAYVSLNGAHLFCQNSQGLVSVSRADQKISQEDVERVLKAAQAIKLPVNKIVLQALVREFIIDNENGIKAPVGLRGIRLEAKANLICLFSPVLENLEAAFREAGIEIEEAIPCPLALGQALLNNQQKELGCCLIDIGAFTTSLAVFEKDELLDFVIFPVGSGNITNDIAIGFRTEVQTAENIKRQFATLNKQSKKRKMNKKEILQQSDIRFSPALLEKIVLARASEIVLEAQKHLKKITNNLALPAGVILGGGGSQIRGLTDFVKEKFALPAKTGSIKNLDLKGFSEAEFGVCLGLLLQGFDGGQIVGGTNSARIAAKAGGFKEIIKAFFKNFLP